MIKHEEELRELFKKSFMLMIIAKNKGLWENLAFYTTCIINLFILVSYSEFQE